MKRFPAAHVHALHMLLMNSATIRRVAGDDFRGACDRGVVAAASYLRRRVKGGMDADTIVISQVHGALTRTLVSRDAAGLVSLFRALCMLDGHLAVWSLSYLGHEILDVLETPEDEMRSLHRLMDLIVGIGTKTSEPIVAFGDLRLPAVRVCSDTMNALLYPPRDREPMIRAVLQLWHERFSTPIAWTLERAAQSQACEDTPSLAAARAKRDTDSAAYARWACPLVLDSLLGYPARA